MKINDLIIRLKEFQLNYDNQHPIKVPDMYLIARILEKEDSFQGISE